MTPAEAVLMDDLMERGYTREQAARALVALAARHPHRLAARGGARLMATAVNPRVLAWLRSVGLTAADIARTPAGMARVTVECGVSRLQAVVDRAREALKGGEP